MRPAGPVDTPIARLTGAGRDDTSRAGVPVSGTSAALTGSGRASLTAALSAPIPGQNGTSPGLPGLSPSLSARLGVLLQNLGIPKDASAFFALKALMGEGLSLGAENIKALRAIAERHTDPRRAAVIAARAMAAGLQPDDEGLDALIRLLSGPPAEDAGKDAIRAPGRQPGRDNESSPDKDTGGEKGGDSEGDPGKDPGDRPSPDSEGFGSGRQGQSGQGGQPSAGDHTMVQHECQDELELRKVLESAFQDLCARASADPGFASLARRGPDGRGWLCVPYQFLLDGVDFSGFFRIVFNYALSRVERLVVELDSSGLTRVCDMSWGPSGTPELRFMPGSVPEGEAFIRLFGSSLKVELIQAGQASDLDDTLYPEVDGHA